MQIEPIERLRKLSDDYKKELCIRSSQTSYGQYVVEIGDHTYFLSDLTNESLICAYFHLGASLIDDYRRKLNEAENEP